MTNLVNLIDILVDKISNSTTEQEILFLSKSIEKLQLNKVKVVANYADMFDGTENNGDLYYVESETALYYTFNSFRILIFESSPIIYGWGAGSYGRLGDNNTTSRSSPVSVVGGFTDWIQVSAGGSHSLGLRVNGTAWAWGAGSYGRLGDGTTVSKSSPVSVIGGFTDWIQVSAGGSHSLGLRSNGTAWAWGLGSSGVLGNNTTVSALSPVSVVGGFTDWIYINAGNTHNLAIRSNGTLWTWGSNSYGRLGDGTTTARSSPVSVVGGFTDWIQASAGFGHSLGVRANGTAWAWGYGTSGRLGDGTITQKSSPVSVVGGFTDWIQVSAGYGHSLGLRSNGTAWAWGSNANTQLGDGTNIAKSSPVSVIGGFTDWTQVISGQYHSLGLRVNGTAWGWGVNVDGRLGDGTALQRSSPVSVFGGFTDWIQIDAGISHSMGLKTQ